MPLDPETLLVLLVLFASTLTKSTFGFGDAMVAMPLLSMIAGIPVARPLVALVSVTIAAVVVLRDWRHVNLRSAGWLVLFAFPGILVGILLLTRLDERIVKILLSLVIILFSGFVLLKPRLFELQTDRTAGIFGFCAGVLGGAYNIHGPPLVIFGTMRNWSAEKFRATLQGYFLPAGLVVVGGHCFEGLLTARVFWLYAIALPIVVLAVACGRALNRRFDSKNFTRYVHGVLILVAVTLLVRTAFTKW